MNVLLNMRILVKLVTGETRSPGADLLCHQNMFQVPRCSMVFTEKATGLMRNISLLAVNHRHYLTVLLLQTAVLSLLSTFHCFSKMCQRLKWFL